VTGASVPVEITRVRPTAELPQYMSADASGADLIADVDAPLTLEPGDRVRVPTGIAIALPRGYEAQVRPRSGFAWRDGVTILNAPGTIDADYRGEVQVILVNHGRDRVTIQRGDRIAQLVVAPVTRAAWQEVPTLAASDRGAGGFGSTGHGAKG
jgi:dUTP pyrophosphatase